MDIVYRRHLQSCYDDLAGTSQSIYTIYIMVNAIHVYLFHFITNLKLSPIPEKN